MGIIKPTLSLTANASSATTEAGPLSFALTLSATDSLDITEVGSKIVDITSTHLLVWDASDYFTAGSPATSPAFGVDGGFMYFKNLLSENTPADTAHDICIGTGNADLDGVGEANRFFTLQPGEFAWMPWDLCQDIYADGLETNASALECWLFLRTGTA
tara:strand:- start:584 stop:1060 length:477 start_codon:yes stop_codon:yes gene_type:complete